MALVKYSGVGITDLAGKIGGTTFQGNVAGRTAVIYAKPAYRRSPTQQLQRSRFHFVLTRWGQLAEAVRADWDTEAATGDWDWTNSLGDLFQPTGQQLFIKLNLSLFTIGQNIVTAPAKPTLSGPLLTGATAVATSTLTLHFDAATIAADQHMLIYASEPMQVGVMSVNHSKPLFVQAIPTGSFSSNPATGAAYNARFGDIVTGLAIFVRAVLLDDNTGDRIDSGLIKCIAT